MRHALVVGLASLALFATPVLTAHAPRPAGAAVARVSGYRVENVSYELGRDRVRAVSFSLLPATAGTVRVQLGKSDTSCAVRRGRAVCTFAGPGPRLDGLTSLAVLAAR
jgi:hypothetical protein